MVKYSKPRKSSKPSKPSKSSKSSKSSKNSNKYTVRKSKKYKPKICGCKLPSFFGGKSNKNKNKYKNKDKNKHRSTRKNLKGGSGLSGLIPSDISNMGRSIMYTIDKNTAIMGGHDLPSNPSPVVQNELNNH